MIPADDLERGDAISPVFGLLRSTLEKVARFVGVGLASSLLYALAVTVATSGLGIHHDASAVLAYTIAIPFNFVMHRRFTFHSTGGVAGDVTRYAVAQAVGILASVAAMAICVDGLGLPYGCGIAAGLVLVPVLTYLLLNHWVFAGHTSEAL